EYKFLKSTATIEYSLDRTDTFLNLKIQLDLKDKEIIVKYFTPINLESEFVYCEAAYGTVKRSRVPKSEMQLAKFEFSMHKWIDISDPDFGVAILNKDRYGAGANHLGFTITLARTPKIPTSKWYPTTQLIKRRNRHRYADMDKHNFELAICINF
ncbi:TPA: hypothetical protein ENS27_17265, partial [bacterium]|nr:hypothetical protein [bacterium]